jgi:hypothetical protein
MAEDVLVIRHTVQAGPKLKILSQVERSSGVCFQQGRKLDRALFGWNASKIGLAHLHGPLLANQWQRLAFEVNKQGSKNFVTANDRIKSTLECGDI